MKVLVCGAGGFIGESIAMRLARDGHTVVRGIRRPERASDIAVDYTVDRTPELWLDKLREVDAVVNAVGIITERGEQTFERIHAEAPIALFTACAMKGIRHIIQISALGAQSRETPYFASKCEADDFVLAQCTGARVIRPALVYGTAGTSARMFRTLASLPIHVLPAGGRQRLRPVHIDDLCDLVARMLDSNAGFAGSACIEAAGATETTYRDMLRIYRESMGLAKAFTIGIPATLMRWAAVACARVPGAMLTPDTWHMLQRGNTADAQPFANALGRAPLGIETFIDAREAPTLRAEAIAAWRNVLLRVALAIVWIVTALVSALAYPRAASLARLSHFGLQGLAADTALYGACALDVGFGVATLIRPGRVLWLSQMALMLFYTLLIAVALPEFLIEPFGPILKNVPILAILILLFNEERRA
ncbi:SDR family oxidoreductase [Trinickia sp.]|uniref:SDR family oxidoreductase n=1 Tax=Trinickia sp. TaxID=2571163 RepID=UPI003F7E40AF